MSSSPGSSIPSTPRRSKDNLSSSGQDEDLYATIDVPVIDRSQIDDLSSTKLGEGTYGYVMKCRFRRTADSPWKNIAIKYGSTSSHRDLIIREAKIIFNHISHPNCIEIFGFHDSPKYGMGVAMELMDCNLANLISKRTIEYKIDHAISWLYQLSDAVNYFHSRNYIHGDLKLQNLLLCDGYHILKVCDFGTFVTLQESMTLNHGTPITMAPEIIRGSKNYTTKCDIYSFGIIMWQIIARRESPYSTAHDAYTIYWDIVTKNLRPPKLKCHEYLSQLYERCWHDDPEVRPTSEHLMEYFSSLKEEYPNADDPLIDSSISAPPVTPPPRASTPLDRKHRRGRSDQSALIQTSGVNGVDGASASKKDEIPKPRVRSSRSHTENTYRSESADERLRPHPRPMEMPVNVLNYIDHSLRPADPVAGDEASEQIYSEHIAACHELHDYDLSLQRALADKHNAIMNLANLQEYRKLVEKKKQLEQLRNDALKKIQQHS
ncbi:hypothetical protein V3C99_003801 [Haemonchus contortus]|uniref:Mitogen-activated protein kinase kinase kinase n=1 Tax=Haemonchus contortus TaxID=6289 RepID=A0A7I5E6D2_HAECO